MNRRGFVGAALAGLGGFLFPQKLKAASYDEITQYDLGTDHIVVRYEVLSKFVRPYRAFSAFGIIGGSGVFFPSYGWIPMYKPECLRGASAQRAYEDMIRASSYKYVYILHNSEENLWGFYSNDNPL